MAQGNGQSQLHLHPLGIVPEFLGFRQVKGFQVPVIGFRIPVPIDRGHDLLHLNGRHTGRQPYGVHHHAQILLDRHISPAVLAQDGDGAAVGVEHIQDDLDCGGLSGTVLPHQP